MKIYVAELKIIVGIMAFADLMWLGIVVLINRKWARAIWKVVNFIGGLISIYGILSYTVLNRTPSDNHIFTFFASYTNEFYREMLMNAFLYFPFGLTLSSLIGPVSILIAFILSLTIETWQYLTGSGVAQGTDVLMNILGAAIGVVPWMVWRSNTIE